MSQKPTASRPSSRRSSLSPRRKGGEHGRGESSARWPEIPGDARRAPPLEPLGGGERWQRQAGAGRSLQEQPPASDTREQGHAPFRYEPPQPRMPGAHADRPEFRAYSSSMPGPGTAPPARSWETAQAGGRRSPTGAPTPAQNNPRRILSPRLSRAASVTQMPQPYAPNPQMAYPSIATSPPEQPYGLHGRESPRVTLPGIQPQSAATPPLMTAPRALSQPVGLSQPTFAGSQAAGTRSSGPSPSLQARGPPVYGPQPPGAGLARSSSVAAPAWATSSRQDYDRPQGPDPSTGEAPQQFFINLPGGETSEIPIDTQSGSRKANEKRQKNASASTRHRQKKKTQQEELARINQDLEEEKQGCMRENDQLRQQVAFYRDERNRLRDIVAGRPGGSDAARGPASPPSPVRTTQLYAGPQRRASPPGGDSDDSAAERPAQRRRLEGPEPSILLYESQSQRPSPGLPPIPSRPTSASSAGSTMGPLPPIRTMQGPRPPATMGPGPRLEQDPRTGQWTPAPLRHLDPGFATGTREPQEGPK